LWLWLIGSSCAQPGGHKLSAYQYFTFFTWLMFGAAIVFVIVACSTKGVPICNRSFTPDEIATEPILHGGTPS